MSEISFVVEKLYVCKEDGTPLGYIEQGDIDTYLFVPDECDALDYDMMSQIQYKLSELNGGSK